MSHHMEEIFAYAKTNFTQAVHNNVYPAISPSRPELSQAGKVVLITGGGDNLGLSIAHAFIEAAAKTVIITGRRADVLKGAKDQLEEKIKSVNSQTAVVVAAVDITDNKQVNELWQDLRQQDITVDVLVSNAAKPPQPKRILEDVYDIWSQVETNARGPLYMIKHLTAQQGTGQKYVVNVSSAVIHSYSHSAVAARPGTVLSKSTGNVIFQLIALETPREELQIVSYNPGLMYNQYMKSLGLPEEQFDSREMAAAFAVWAATKEAAFLHGRFVWASWDVEELASGEIRQQIDEDPYLLRSTIAPLKLGFRSD